MESQADYVMLHQVVSKSVRPPTQKVWLDAPSPLMLRCPETAGVQFPAGSQLSSKEYTYQCRRHRSDPWFGKIPWRRKWPPTPAFLPGESHGQRSLVGYSPRGRKCNLAS